MIKYKTEQEFCEYVTKLILGILAGEGRQIICVPEVPRYYFSNENVDMLLLDVKNLELISIEYKLNSAEILLSQVRDTSQRGLPCIGIINSEATKEHCEEGNFYRVFGYTGKDSQLEKLADYLVYATYSHWGTVYGARRMMYYWAYKNNESRFDGGRPGGKRQRFFQVYIQAIRNLHAHYGRLDFMLTHMALGNVYSVNVSRKYYLQAIED